MRLIVVKDKFLVHRVPKFTRNSEIRSTKLDDFVLFVESVTKF